MKRSRKLLSLILTVAMVFTAMPGTGILLSYAEEAVSYTVSLASDSEEIAAGSTFIVKLSVSSPVDGTNAAALHSEMTYDTSKVEFIEASAPAGSDLNAAANAENGKVTVESYGKSQNVSGSGAVMAELKFKAKDSVSGSAEFSLVSGKSLVGRSGEKAEIKAGDGGALTVALKYNDPNKRTIYFGLEGDGLTWNLLTVNGNRVEKSVRGGDRVEGIVSAGDEITFSIDADDGVQYTNIRCRDSTTLMIREKFYYDTSVSESNGVYTTTLMEGKGFYEVDASTLKVEENENAVINTEFSSNQEKVDTGSNRYIESTYASLNASAKIKNNGRIVKWSYSENGGEWVSLGIGNISDNGTYVLDKQMPRSVFAVNFNGSNYSYFFENVCYRLKMEVASETIDEISTEADLRRFAEAVNNGDPYTGVTVKLLNDIKLTEPWDRPIGISDTAHFAGTFDGNNCSISGLEIDHTYTDSDRNGTAAFGLFGYTKGAVIKDLTVSGKININDTSKDYEYVNQGDSKVYIGAVAGYAGFTYYDGKYDFGSFEGCISEVDITAYSGYVGGIAGYAAVVWPSKKLTEEKDGIRFTDCFNYGDITITGRNVSACGISGYEGLSFERCGNYGDINIKCGQLKVLEKPPASAGGGEGTIKTYDVAIGSAAGIAVNCVESVKQCFNKGNVSGTALRLAGLLAGQDSGLEYYVTDLKISDSYNTGKIELPIKHNDSRYYNGINNDYYLATVGGIISYTNGNVTLTNCYSAANTVIPLVEGTVGLRGSLYNEAKNNETSVNIVNCYGDDTEPSVAGLKAAGLNTDDETFKDDDNMINGGMPLLYWEAYSGSDEEYSVSFDTNGVSAKITLYKDAEHKNVIEPVNGSYKLKAGSYYYNAVASEEGYEEVNGSFSVIRKDVNISVTFKAVSDVTITVSPAEAEIKLTTAGGEAVQPKLHNGGSYVFTLYKGSTYIYTVSADGYNGKTHTFVADGSPVSITLTKSSWSDGEQSGGSLIYGSYNTGKTSTITKGGIYYIQKGSDVRSQGRITISTSERVTLIGKGYSDDDMYEDLYIKYTVSGADLTIQDVYIHNTLDCEKKTDMGSIIDFTGKGNKLKISGTNILDWNGNASGYAAIHVDQNTDLTISGSDSDILYLYKYEQGAGIGGNGGADDGEGQLSETNGDITFDGGTYFIKNSKQGAGIGAGAKAGLKKPGSIRLEGGSFYIIANSRGAAIGGSAGSGGASTGSDVYISESASVTINIDYTGAAIGGGGYKAGNDADGGTLYYESGSIRAYIDVNAVAHWGVSEDGVNGNEAITAKVVNKKGEQLYLLELDTSKLAKSASIFTVKDGETTVYSGRLHEYRYVNEDSDKSDQSRLSYTIDNWTSLDDSKLYLYMTGADRTLDVNGETVTVKWDASAGNFTLTYPDGTTDTGAGSGGGSLAGDQTPIVSETVKPDVTVNGENAEADVKKDDINSAAEAVGSGSNAQIAIDAASGKSGITHAEVSLPMESVKKIQKDTKADIVIKTDLGDITVDNSDLSALTVGSGSDVTFTIDKNEDGSMKLNITSGGKNIASGKDILRYRYKIDDAVMKSLAGSTGVDNSDLVGALVGAKGADGKAVLTVIRDSFVTADGYLVINAPVGGTLTVTANGKIFKDVAANAWYAKAVGFAVSHELFNGISDNEFAPSKSMTRGMFVTVLNRLADAEDFSGSADFKDVASDKWYATGIAWAASKGIVKGYGDGKFGPDDPITREQMAVIMYNFTKVMGYDVKGSAGLEKFSDSALVDSWASEAMQWAVGAGVMNGNADSTLDPRGTATRAQVATILMNYIQALLGVK